MPSLPQVLHQAASQGATEVILEPGAAPVVRSSAGSANVGDTWNKGQLFDALAQILGPDQQADLAVGHVVTFHLDVEGGRWSLVTEPRADGLVVRGRIAAADPGAEVGTPLELPPLEPFEPERGARAPGAPKPVFSGGGTHRQTAWDLDVSPVDDSASTARDQPAVRSEAASDPESEDAGVDFALRAPEAEFELEPESSEAVELGEPEPLSPSPMFEDASVGMDHQLEELADEDLEFELEESHDAPAQSSGGALEDGTRAELQAHARSLLPGTVALVRGPEAASVLADSAVEDVPVFRIDASSLARLGSRTLDQPAGATYVVSLEDPGMIIGWILRRIEEGARVVVETRALTFDGARRVLLGTDASERVEDWLSSHTLLWVAPDEDGRWVLDVG